MTTLDHAKSANVKEQMLPRSCQKCHMPELIRTNSTMIMPKVPHAELKELYAKQGRIDPQAARSDCAQRAGGASLHSFPVNTADR
jgi:hypothetical protein